jgi:uncharacterized protein YggU (UPF0235/DUF167 family)
MYIKVRAIPNSKKETVEKKSSTEFVVAVREKAERSMANKRIQQILQEELALVYKPRLISGHHSQSKIFSIEQSKG